MCMSTDYDLLQTIIPFTMLPCAYLTYYLGKGMMVLVTKGVKVERIFVNMS